MEKCLFQPTDFSLASTASRPVRSSWIVRLSRLAHALASTGCHMPHGTHPPPIHVILSSQPSRLLSFNFPFSPFPSTIGSHRRESMEGAPLKSPSPSHRSWQRRARAATQHGDRPRQRNLHRGCGSRRRGCCSTATGRVSATSGGGVAAG
jgi:hypothetical protein